MKNALLVLVVLAVVATSCTGLIISRAVKDSKKDWEIVSGLGILHTEFPAEVFVPWDKFGDDGTLTAAAANLVLHKNIRLLVHSHGAAVKMDGGAGKDGAAVVANIDKIIQKVDDKAALGTVNLIIYACTIGCEREKWGCDNNMLENFGIVAAIKAKNYPFAVSVKASPSIVLPHPAADSKFYFLHQDCTAWFNDVYNLKTADIVTYMRERTVAGDNAANTFLTRCKAVIDAADGSSTVKAKLGTLVGALKTGMDEAAAEAQQADTFCNGHEWNTVLVPKYEAPAGFLESNARSHFSRKW